MMKDILTKHSEMRMRQRGIPNELLGVLLDWGDVEVSVGGGDQAISISRKAVRELRARGLRSDWCEKLIQVSVVVTSDGVVKTALIRNSGRDGHRYRRGI